MVQLSLDYKHFKNYDNKTVSERAAFCNVKLVYGFELIIRAHKEINIYNFLKHFDLEYKAKQIKNI